MKNEVINLCVTEANGAILSETKYQVFAEKKSVTRTEFYGAYQTGLNPKYIFVVNSLDYEMTRRVEDSIETYAQKVEYNGAKFTIIRTYDDGNDVELTVG